MAAPNTFAPDDFTVDAEGFDGGIGAEDIKAQQQRSMEKAASQYFTPEAAAQRNIQDLSGGINRGLRQYVAPVLGGLSGAALGTAIAGGSGGTLAPLAPVLGAGAGTYLTRKIIQAGDYLNNKLFDVPFVEPPPSFRQDITEAGAAMLGQGIGSAVEGAIAKNAAKTFKPGTLATSGVYEPPMRQWLRSGNFRLAPEPPVTLPRFVTTGGLFNREITPVFAPYQHSLREAADAAAAREALTAETAAKVGKGGRDIYGKSADVNPAELSTRLGTAVNERQSQMAAGARSRGYTKYDKLLRDERNLAPPGSVQVGEDLVNVDGEMMAIPRMNAYPIETPFDMRPLAADLEELAHELTIARIPPESKLHKMVTSLTDLTRDWQVPLDTAYRDYSQLLKYASTKQTKGTSSALQRTAVRIAEKMKGLLDDTYIQAARNARVAPKNAQNWRTRGVKAWAERAQIFDTPTARTTTKALTTQHVRQLLGTNNAKAGAGLTSYLNQVGPSGADDLIRAHWRDAVNMATEKGKINPYIFDQAFTRPGGDTLDILYSAATRGKPESAIGRQAVRNTARQLHDSLVEAEDFSGWQKLSTRTRSLIADHNPDTLSALDDFYKSMEAVKTLDAAQQARINKLVMEALASPDSEVNIARYIATEALPVIARGMTTPGAGGATTRRIIRGVGKLLSGGDVGRIRNLTNNIRIAAKSPSTLTRYSKPGLMGTIKAATELNMGRGAVNMVTGKRENPNEPAAPMMITGEFD